MRFTRIIALAATAVLLQVAVMPHFRLFDTLPDIALIVAVALAWAYGGETGAWFGFVTGLSYDFFVTTPFAMTALAYGVTAYFAASLFGAADRRVPALIVGFSMIAGVLSGVVFVTASILAGGGGVQRGHSLLTVVIAALYDGLLALPIFAVVQRVVGDTERARS